MARYKLTNQAVLDLSAIWDYTVDTWSESQADKYYFMLLDTCQDLADGKISGKNYPEISNEIFGFTAGQHILFYRKISQDNVEIARILHTQMDLKKESKSKTTANIGIANNGAGHNNNEQRCCTEVRSWMNNAQL